MHGNIAQSKVQQQGNEQEEKAQTPDTKQQRQEHHGNALQKPREILRNAFTGELQRG